MLFETLPTTIVRYPDPRLRGACAPVDPTDEQVGLLAERMFELMKQHNGVGLAAPQVGLNVRMFVCNPTGEPEDSLVLVNPVLSELTGSEEGEEGCLSIPEVRVRVRRAKRCRVVAHDPQGALIEIECSDLLARIMQHENDHLEGKLIIDRMDGPDRIANKKAIAQLEADFKA